MKAIIDEKTKPILESLCIEHGVSIKLFEELLSIEKEYQIKERRHGIYEKIKDTVESELLK